MIKDDGNINMKGFDDLILMGSLEKFGATMRSFPIYMSFKIEMVISSDLSSSVQISSLWLQD